MFDYKLIRTRRKTVAIYVTKNAEIEVRAPIRMPKAYIDGIVRMRSDWIASHVELRKDALAKKAAFRLDYYSALRFCGESVVITAHETKRGFEYGRFFAPPGFSPDELKSAATACYIERAKEILPEKTRQIGNKMGVSAASVRISGARAQWGSCSGKNRISYSWRLMMAGMEEIDYVVTHELAHIRELNHSPRFWAVIERHMPDWRERVSRLSELQKQLMNENWD